jgi:hypothetical protein
MGHRYCEHHEIVTSKKKNCHVMLDKKSTRCGRKDQEIAARGAMFVRLARVIL